MKFYLDEHIPKAVAEGLRRRGMDVLTVQEAGRLGDRVMIDIEKMILGRFKTALSARVSIYKMILFGSRARGDADPYSDMDIAVILNEPIREKDIDYVSDCAWESGFEHGIVIVPVVFTREEWENSPERFSLLVQAAETDGIPI